MNVTTVVGVMVMAAAGLLLAAVLLLVAGALVGIVGAWLFKRLRRIYDLGVIVYWLDRLEKEGTHVFRKASEQSPRHDAHTPAAGQYIPANFTTHRSAWRDAITECINTETARGNHDQAAYWEHELAAMDRAFGRLLDNPEPVKTSSAQAGV
jgi:hypothetical protein